MNDNEHNNPYQAPETISTNEDPHTSMELHPPKSVTVGQAVAWISTGLRLFRSRPLDWALVGLVYLVASFGVAMIGIFMNILPILGTIAGQVLMGIVGMFFFAGFMQGCQQITDGENFRVADLFMGFNRNAKPLALAAVILMVVVIVILLLTFGLMLGPGMISAMEMGDASAMQQNGPMVAIAGLIYLGLIIPVVMAAYFTPALILFHNLSATDALKMSFSGCLKNIVPFLVYGIVCLLALVGAAIVLALAMVVLNFIPFLGFLVALFLYFAFMVAFMAVAFGSIYGAYRDIYVD